MFGRKLEGILQDLQQLGVLESDPIGKIDVDFRVGNRQIIVERDEEDGTVKIFTENRCSWVKDY